MLRADHGYPTVAVTRARRDPLSAGRSALIIAAALLSSGAANGVQTGGDLRVDWSTIDAGGGTATGGAFAVTGTIAQIDADLLHPASGGNFVLTGGFWVIQTAPSSELLFRSGFE